MCSVTPPFNVLVLARHQPLYSTLQFKQGPVFLLNSRLATFAASPIIHRTSPYSEVTNTFLPSSLTRDHSYTLGFSPCPPVSVCDTVNISLALEVFLGSIAPGISSCENFIQRKLFISGFS